MDLAVRNLRTKDVFRVAHILARASKQSRKSLVQAVQIDTEDGPQTVQIESEDVGWAIFEALLEREDDLKELLADLCGKNAAEFDELPYDAMLTIIERIAEQDDLSGFLSRVMALVNRLSGSLSTSSSPDTAGPIPM